MGKVINVVKELDRLLENNNFDEAIKLIDKYLGYDLNDEYI